MTPARRLVLAGLAAAAFGAPARAEEKKKGGGESYVQFPTITATLLRPGGRGVMTMEAGVDAHEPALHARVLLLQPRLQDAYTSTLATFAASLAPGALPDVELLVQRLQAATDRVVGRPGVRFLIGAVLAE